jgi:hypothetical protein
MTGYIQEVAIFPPNLSNQKIIAVTENMSDYFFDTTSSKSGGIQDIVAFEKDFESLKLPENRLIKLSKTEYIDDFFENGRLHLGSFEYYSNFDNNEIGDKKEGSYILVGRNPTQTVFAKIGGGPNNYLFCCYDGEPDKSLLKKFNYNDYFEIVDVQGFRSAIEKSLGASKSDSSKCLYRKLKVIVGESPENYVFNEISMKLLNLVNDSKYYLKTSDFEHQKESRFVWTIDGNVPESTIIDCPEAIKYCKRK